MSLPPIWYLGLVVLEGSARLAELRVSRRRETGLRGVQAAAGSYPLMVALHVALCGAPLAEIALRRRRARAPRLWVGLLGVATGLRWWSIAALGPSWNVRAVVPSDLRPVSDGPYRFVRHPNYLAVALEVWSLPMAGGAWLSALGLSALNCLLLLDRVRAEERLLAAVPGYAEAMGGRARFLPGIF